jgi:hypothetical protein
MTKGFLWFWKVPRGGTERIGLNLIVLPRTEITYGGFVLILKTRVQRFRFRFRRGLGFKHAFLWSRWP